jgi:hypothetical protein
MQKSTMAILAVMGGILALNVAVRIRVPDSQKVLEPSARQDQEVKEDEHRARLLKQWQEGQQEGKKEESRKSKVEAQTKGKQKVVDGKDDAATTVMDNLKHIANVFEEGGHLVVEFIQYPYPNDINKRLQLIRAVADADATLTEKARLIYFYNPDGKQMGKAHPYSGIKLTE